MVQDKHFTQIELDGWPFKIKQPEGEVNPKRVMLLLHGHRGNEKAMWILTNPLPKGYTLLAPRAPVKIDEGEYSWHQIEPNWPDIATYEELIDQLLSRVDSWFDHQGLSVEKFDVMGFSQGAAMAYAMAIVKPGRTGKVAALAGFIPQSWRDSLTEDALSGKSFFIAHGSQDEIIPIHKARQTSEWLEEKGAQVNFCEADTGHKLSANCFNGLGEFFFNDR